MVRTSVSVWSLYLDRIALVAGCAILIFGAARRLGRISPRSASFIIGIGMGFSMSVFIVSIQASVPWAQRGAATSSTMFLRFMGQVMGVSGCGAVLNATIDAAWMQARPERWIGCWTRSAEPLCPG